MHIDFKPGDADQGVFIIQDDGSKMTAPFVSYSDRKCAFWISSEKDGHISSNSSVGLPIFPNMYKMELTKISDNNK